MPFTRNCLRYISVPLFLALMTLRVSAQEKGYVSGGVESNSAFYSNSAFHSNNYLKLDYVRGRFSDIVKLLTNKRFILIALLCVFFYCCIISFKKFGTSIVIPRFDMELNSAKKHPELELDLPNVKK